MAQILKFSKRRLPDVLLPMMEKNQWVVWRYEMREGDDGNPREMKPPYQLNGQFAKTNNKETWCSYEDAFECDRKDGVGFVFLDSGFVGLDLDDCRDSETGEVTEWAQQVMGSCHSYCEISPSGTGVHIVGYTSKGPFTETLHRGGGGKIEIYRNHTHYMTITGNQIGNCVRLRNLDDVVDALVDGAEKKVVKGDKDKTTSGLWHQEVCRLYAKGWSPERIAEKMKTFEHVPERYRDRMLQEVKRSIRNSKEYAAEEEGDRIDFTRGDQVEPKTFEWLWPGRFCVGKIAIIGGVKERGKSLITIDLAARITCGRRWPDGMGHAPKGSVIMLALAEDDLEDTVLPRFMAARGNRSKVYFVDSTLMEGKSKMFSLHNDIQLLEQMVEEIGDVKAIVIDPISSYMGVGKVDTFRESDVRGILSPLKVMANKTGVAVFAVRHFSKNDKVEVLNRFLDSIAFVNAARHVYVSLDHPFEEDEMLFMPCANNLAKRGMRGLSYHIGSSREVMTSTGGIYPPYIRWDPEPVNMTVNQVNEEVKRSRGRPGEQSEFARKFLIDLLENGSVESTVAIASYKKMSLSDKTIERVRKELGIKSKRVGEKWYWEMPTKQV